MLGVTDVGVFIAGTIAIVLLPGPNSLYVLTVAARSGLRCGYAGALGIFTGDAVLMVLTALGAASVLQSNPLVYQAVRWSGALYLSYLGVRLMWGAWLVVRQNQGHGDEAPASAAQVMQALKPVAETSGAAVYRKALLISLLNPKAILFFLSFFVQFVDPNYAYPGLSFLFLGVIVQMASLLYLTVLILGGVRLAQTFAQRRQLSALLSTTVGLLFIGFGLRLAS
jgi:leucine efflux protein